MTHFVSMRDVTYTYRRSSNAAAALNGVNLDFARGESTAIVGRSGSGKSTLVSLLALMRTPTAGTLEIAGNPTHAMSRAQVARLRSRYVGMVFQSFHLNPSLLVGDNVLLPWLAGARRSSSRVAKAHVDECLAAVGLADTASRRVTELSGGERQRVAIARALFSKPRLLIADEPTGNLDEDNATAVASLLFDLPKTHGTCVVVVTHDLAIAGEASRIVRIERGEVRS